MSEEKVKELTKDIQRRIKSTNRWLSANKSIGNPEGEAFRQIEIYELALGALTQPASPALKLPDCPFPCGWKELLRLAMRDGAFLARDLIEGDPVTEFHRRSALTNTDRLIQVVTSMIAAPHAAHIEPSCAKGGAEWVKVPQQMTPEMLKAVQQNTEIGSYIAANWAGAYALFDEFYKAALAATPKG